MKAAGAKHGNGASGLAWGPHTDEVDLFPEEAVKKITEEGMAWDVRWVSPLAIRFSQGKVHPFFHERGPVTEVLLQIQVVPDLEGSGEGGTLRRIQPPFPPIRLLHLKQQGALVTLDNRRLYALQLVALQEWPAITVVKTYCVDELTPARLKAENRKFTNRIGGLQIEVESRCNAFDTFSWVTEAARTEAPRFCKPIAFRAVDKAISLLPVLVVNMLLSPRLRPFMESRWPLLKFAAVTTWNPQRRAFPTRRLLLLHVLELARPRRQVCQCPPLCVGYRSETVVALGKGRSCVSSRLSISRPLSLQKAHMVLSPIQRRVLAALLPLYCLPYARSALEGTMREYVVSVLLAWAKIAMTAFKVPRPETL